MAPPPLEATTRGGRVLIISTATVSLLLVGMLALLMTPSRSRNADDAEAIVTDFVTFAASGGSPDGTGSSSSGGRTSSPTSNASGDVPAGRTLTTPTVSSGFGNAEPNLATTTPVVAITIAGAVVVTPIGNGLAVTTESAVDGDDDGPIDAVLPSGETVVAEVVVAADGVVFVAIADEGTGMAIADDAPPTEVVYVDIDGTAVPVEPSALTAMSLPEATPVLDEDGNLIGLCTHGRDGIEVIPVGTPPALPTTTLAATESSTPVDSTVGSSIGVATTTAAATTEVPVTESTVSSDTAATDAPSTSSSTSTSIPGR